MSSLSLNVSLNLKNQLSPELERAVRPAQALAEQFSKLSVTAERLKLPNINAASLTQLKNEALAVADGVSAMQNKLNKLNALKLKLDIFERTKKETKQAQAELNQHKKSIDALKKQINQGGGNPALKKQLKALESEAKKLQNTVDKNTPKLKQWRKELNDAGLGSMSLANAKQKLAQQIHAAQVAMDAEQSKLTRLGAAQKNHAAAVDKARSAIARQKQALEDYNTRLEKYKTRVEQVQRISTTLALGAGMTGRGLLNAVKEYADSQDAETTLRISMMDKTGNVAKEYAEIVKLAERMGTKLPGSTADFKQMMAVLVQQGISFKAILGGVGESAGYLAVLLKKPFDEAAMFAAKMQDATKTAEKDMMALMDTVQKMYHLGADDSDIQAGFGNLAPAMSVIRKQGLEFANMMAPFLVMTDQAGMNGDSAGNAYRKIFSKMMDVNKINKALKDAKLDLNLDFTDGKGEFGGIKQMYQELEKFKGLTTQKRLEILQDIFGNDAEVARVLNLLIDKGIDGYNETAAKMQQQADINQRVQASLSTLRNLWDALSGTATSLMARAGEALAPWIEQMTIFLTKLGEKLSAWIDKNPELFNGIVQVVAVIATFVGLLAVLATAIIAVLGPLTVAKLTLSSLGLSFGLFGKAAKLTLQVFTKFGGAIKALPAIFSAAKGAIFGLVGALKGAFTALIANPIGLKIAAIVAVIALAAFLIYKYWKPIKAFFAGVWDGIKAAFEPMMPLFAKLGAWLSPVIDWFKSLFDTTQAGEGSARALGQTVGTFLANAFSIATFPLRTLVAIGQWAWDTLTGLFSGELSVGDIFAGLRGKWEAFIDKISEWYEKAKQLWQKFKGLFTSSDGGSTSPTSAGAQSSGIWSNITQGFESARTTIAEKVAQVWEGAKVKFDEARLSLSEKAGGIISAITEALSGAGGLSGVISSAISAALSHFGQFIHGASALLSALPKVVATIFNGLSAIISTAMGGMVRVVATKITALLSAMRSGFARLRGIVATMWQALGSAMSGNPMLSRLQAAMNACISYLNGVKGQFTAIGYDIGNGLASGMERSLARVQGIARQMAATVESAARVQLNTHSPSRVMMAVGRDVVAGLDVGMTRRFAPTLSNFKRHIGQFTKPVDTPRIQAVPPISKGAAVGGGAQHYAGDTITININAGAGNAQDIARQIKDALAQHERDKLKRLRNSYYDRG